MAVSCDAASLTTAAKCFDCIPREMWGPVELYLLALAAGGSMDPATLLAGAKCFECVPRQMEDPVELYLLSLASSSSSDAATLVSASKCFSCIPPKIQVPVDLYLLASASGAPTDSASLVALAKCFRCIPIGDRALVKNYLLCTIAGASSCDSASLVSAARCLQCAPVSRRQAVKTYLLCQGVNFGFGLGPGIIPPGATYDPTGSYTIAVSANTTYIVTWGPNDTSFNMCGDVYTNPGGSLTTTIYTSACTSLVFTGLGGSTVTAQVHKPKPGSKTPVPSGFTWTMNAAGTTATATWNSPPGFVDSTELWTSSDGVTFTLAATVARPGTSSAQAAPAVGSVKYAKVRWISSSSSPSSGPFSSVLNVPTTVVATWATRVVANGGAAPAASVVSAQDTFYKTLVSSGLLSKMIAVNSVAPGDHFSMRTPLIVGPGNDPWNTTTIQAGAVTAQGWFDTPGAVQQCQQTGCKPTTMGWTAASAGFTFYASFNNAANTLLSCGVSNAGGADPLIGMYHCYSGVVPHSQTSYLFTTTNQTSRQLGDLTGFISANRISTTNHADYWANSTNAFQTLSTEANVNAAPTQARDFYFGGHNDGGTPASSNRTYGFFALHMGLTAAEAQTFYNAIQILMTAWGWQV